MGDKVGAAGELVELIAEGIAVGRVLCSTHKNDESNFHNQLVPKFLRIFSYLGKGEGTAVLGAAVAGTALVGREVRGGFDGFTVVGAVLGVVDGT